MSIKDTIYAPVTVPGEGGITIIRVSGPDSLRVLNELFSSLHNKTCFKSHFFYRGNITGSDGEVIDEVLAVYMQGPRSYTADDVVEIHCHSNRFVVSKILAEFSTLGFRSAEAGEFTKRAFLNGRIDLPQAEAIVDLINSKSELGRRTAVKQLDGYLSERFSSIKEHILSILSLVEAYIDFPDEDIDISHINTFRSSIDSALALIDSLVDTYRSGRIYKEGISVLVLGKPNVGKSSLLNFLLSSDRAIVTDVPGTTRDLIEEKIQINGLSINIIDSAGIRQTDDPVEKVGVEKSQNKISSVDLVLFLCDGSRPIDDEDLAIFKYIADIPSLVVVNKSDLFDSFPELPFVESTPVSVSTHTGEGMDILKSRICGFFESDEILDMESAGFISEYRHFELLNQCSQHLKLFLDSIGQSEEFLATHLGDALSSIGEITGETTPDDILDRIFSKFCIGK